MRCCRDCQQDKPLSDYYRTSTGTPMHICKDCHKERMRVNRLLNPAVQERERERYKNNPARRARMTAYSKKWREQHPIAYKAQTAVGNAIRDGKLQRKPCALCGTDRHVHAHHKDYTKPLDVTWLCAKCHNRLHSVFPELCGHFVEAAE